MEIIYKHTNRKLYSHATHKYVRLEDIFARFMKGKRFKVLEWESLKDITDEVILQCLGNPANTNDRIKMEIVHVLVTQVKSFQHLGSAPFK